MPVATTPNVFVYYGAADGANDPTAWDNALSLGRKPLEPSTVHLAT